MSPHLSADKILQISDVKADVVNQLLGRYGLVAEYVPDAAPITASFWGEPEAGIVGRQVFVRGDTPVHSMLHEVCHIICMSAERRDSLYRDAGGNDLEESAVCYLQVILADFMTGVGRARLMQDMDSWGYSFRLGSTECWFADDADDARAWLIEKGLLTVENKPVFRLRGAPAI
ncbi:MAG: hypothetical protein DRQ63_07085 [Gammaproteobacteria bacterium]|nr:MAG: hypothetical protein DRQ63_07085 [Gammaproteobacteria bacterium]